MELKARIALALAAIWGLAEATFFFIVPDVLLTAVLLALGWAVALRAVAAAALCAALGGLAMRSWGARDIEAARAAMLDIPLVGADLLARAGEAFAGPWAFELARGAITGVPYKLYAIEAGAADIDGAGFFAVSLVARAARFLLALGVAAAGFRLAAWLGLRSLRGPGLALAWAGLYAYYVAARLAAGG